jgi:predicted HAD superfamily Cof-like phosphohydrolase
MLPSDMSSNYRNQARIFRQAMDQPMGCFVPEVAKLQECLIVEEFTELLAAMEAILADLTNKRAREEALKELTDLVVVCFQLAEAVGWDLDVAYNRVMQSNMSKFGDDGKPIRREDGKILKGHNYKPPVLIDLV